MLFEVWVPCKATSKPVHIGGGNETREQLSIARLQAA